MSEEDPKHGERDKDNFMFCRICNAWINPIYLEKDAELHLKDKNAIKFLREAITALEV